MRTVMRPTWKGSIPPGLPAMCFILCLSTTLSFAEESVPTPGQLPALGSLQEKMLAENPELQAAKAASRAARAKAGVAGGLDAPQVGVDFFQAPAASFPDPLKDNSEIDYFAQQDIMFPGRLIAMGTAENRRADMLEQDARMRELRLVRDLKSAYYELYEIDRKLEINRQNQDLVHQLQDIARKQYELGMGNQSDVLRAQTEYSSLQNARLVLVQSRQAMAAELNAMLTRPADATFESIPALEPPKPVDWTLEQLKPLAEKNQPEVQAALSGIEMSRAERGAAFWGFFPDFMVKGAYKQMIAGPDNFWELMVGITLPEMPWALPKTISKYRQTAADVEQSEANFRQAQNMVMAQLQQSLSRVKANQDIEQLNRTTLLPQAEQTLQSTLSAYQTGKRDFMTLLDAYRMVWTARENHVMAVKNLYTSLADLEQAVGMGLPEVVTALGPKEAGK